MRLYLSSYRLGARAGILRWTGGSRGRAGLVSNALDIYGADRLRSWDREAGDLAELGYDTEELDLRRHVERPEHLATAIRSCDLLWVPGGGAFALATIMTACRFGDALAGIWEDGGPIYAGYSAGACVAGPDLDGIDLIDDPDDIPSDYPAAAPTTLGLIPQRIVPHWRSDHPGAPGAERAVEHLRGRGAEFVTLRDGEDLLVGID